MSSLKKSQANAEARRARLNESRASPAGSAHDMGDLSNLEEELEKTEDRFVNLEYLHQS